MENGNWFENLDNWALIAIVCAALIVVVIIITCVSLFVNRKSKLHTVKITIDLDGGKYNDDSKNLVLEAKVGAALNLAVIQPNKEGYEFNGFNFYKADINHELTKEGQSEILSSDEIMDGSPKDVIKVPPYDLYLVAKYSPSNSLRFKGLKEDTYFSSFLTFEDLISEVKHLNEDKENYPVPIRIKKHSDHLDKVFIFKDNTIFAILQNYHGISKVYLRTHAKDVKPLLLNDFYQEEDINDSCNWYSFVVIYNTKMSRFINHIKQAYDEADVLLLTSKTEFNLIINSLSRFADPILDRALLLVKRHLEEGEEKEEQTKEEVKVETPVLEVEKVEEKTVEEKKETKTLSEIDLDLNIKSTRAEDNPSDYEIEGPKEEVKESVTKVEVVEEVLEEAEEIQTDGIDEIEHIVDRELTEEELMDNILSTRADIEEDDIDLTSLTEDEKKEIKIKKSPLRYNRKKLINLIMSHAPDYVVLRKKEQLNQPYSLKVDNRSYAMIYENRFGLLRCVVKLENNYAKIIAKRHINFHKAKFPIGANWFEFYFDNSFTSKSEVLDIFTQSRLFVRKQKADKTRKEKK